MKGFPRLADFFRLVLKNMLRNTTRTVVTALGTMILVFIVTLIWSILHRLNKETTEKSADFKAIVTEKWQIPSQMPYRYVNDLERGGAKSGDPNAILPTDFNTWSFYGGFIGEKRSFENIVFAFVMPPAKIMTMMDGLSKNDLTPAEFEELRGEVEKLQNKKDGILLGRDRLKTIGKKVGERFKITSFNFRDINLEFEIVGVLPNVARYNNGGFIRTDYFLDAFEQYKAEKGKPHPSEDKSLALVWMKVPDSATYEKLANQVVTSPSFKDPVVKIETAASGVSAFIESYKDLIWGMRWILAPSILASLALLIANAISISVRERRTEMAVLKVLGFRPIAILLMVMMEALMVGAVSALIAAVGTFLMINKGFGAIPVLQFGFISGITIPPEAILWGLGMGTFTAIVGSIVPALNACRVKVAEVFSRVG